MKQRLVKLFTDHRAETALSKDELNAIVQYLEKYIEAFHPSKLKPNSLSKLVRKSAVLEIESDNVYFSHNLDQNEEFMKGRDPTGSNAFLSLNKKLTA